MAGLNSILAGAAFVKVTMDSAELTKGLKQAQSQLTRFIAGIREYGDSVTFVSTMMQAPFKAAIDSFSEFDLKMRQVKAITSATSDAMDDLAMHARKLGRDTSFTTSQVSDAMIALGRLGFTAKEVKEATKPVMNLAKATGDELGMAAQVAGNNMRVFGAQTSDLGRITDIIVTTVNKSSQSLNDYAEAAAKAGPSFVQGGQDIMEMSAAIGILANMGIRGAIAGTAVARAMKRFADPNVQSVLDSYGVSVKEINGQMRPLHETLADVGKLMAGLQQDQRIHLAEEIFEVRGALAGLPLSVNARGIDDLLAKLRMSKNAAADAAEEMDSGVYGAIKRLESALNDLKIEVGGIMSETFLPWIDDAKELLNTIRKTSPAFRELLSVAVKLGAVLSILGLSSNVFAKWSDGVRILLTPLNKLNDLLLGAQKKAEIAAYESQKKSIQEQVGKSREVAIEKAAAAAKIKGELDVAEAKAKTAKAEQDASEKMLDANRKEMRQHGAKIRDLRSEQSVASTAASEQIGQSNEKIRLLEEETIALRKKNIEQRNTLKVAETDLTEKTRTSRNASMEYRQAKYAAYAKSVNDFTRAQTSREVERKKADMDALETLKDKSSIEAKAANEALARSRAEFESTSRSLKAAQENLAMRKLAYQQGQQGSKGLLAAEEKKIKALKRTKSELREQIILQEQNAKELSKRAREYASNYNRSRTSYFTENERLSKISTAGNLDQLRSDAERKRSIEETAKADMAAASAAVNRINSEIAATEMAIKDNEAKISALSAERDAQYQTMKAASDKTSIEISGEQNAIELLKEKNAELARENRIRKDNLSTAQREYAKKLREYGEAEKASRDAQKKTDDLSASVNALRPENVRFKEDEDKVRLAREREFSDLKIRDAKREAYERTRIDAEQRRSAFNSQNEYHRQMSQRIAEEEEWASSAMVHSRWRETDARKELARNTELANAIRMKYDTAIQGSVKYSAQLREQIAADDAALARVNANDNFISNNSKAVAIEFYDKRMAQNNRLLAQQERQIALMESEKAAQVRGYDMAIECANGKIEAETAYQSTIQRTIDARLEELSLINQQRVEFGRDSAKSEAALADALNEVNEAEKNLKDSRSARWRAEREGLTVSQRWSRAFATRSKTLSSAIRFARKHAAAILKTSVADMVAAKADMHRAKTGMEASFLRKTGYLAEAAGAKVAALATLSLSSALDFLKKNWITVAFFAITGVITMMRKASEKAARKVNELAKESAIAAGRANEQTQQYRKVVKSEQEQVQYLVDLENQHSATAEQQAAAMQILDALEDKYGKLGITVNNVTGAIEGAYDAQRKLSAEWRKVLVDKYGEELSKKKQAAIDALNAQVANAQKESGLFAYALKGTGVNKEHEDFLKMLGFEFNRPTDLQTPARWTNKYIANITDMTKKELEEYKKQVEKAFDFVEKHEDWNKTPIENLRDRLQEVIDTMIALRRVQNGDLSDGEANRLLPGQEALKAPEQSEIENAMKRIAEMNKRNSDLTISSLKKETDAIEEQKKEYRSYIDLLTRAETIKQHQAEDNLERAVVRMSIIRSSLSALSKNNKDGKNNEQITALNDEYIRLTKNVEGFNRDMLNAQKAIDELSDTWSKASDEYARQLNQAWLEDYKRRTREMREQSSLANPWVDALGRGRAGTLFEEQNKSFAQKRENDFFQKLMNDSEFVSAMVILSRMISRNSGVIRESTRKYNDLLRSAETSGYYNGTMTEQDRLIMDDKIGEMSNILRDAVERDTQLRNRYDEARKAALEAGNTREQAIGSFSAKALSESIGADSMQARVVKATEGSRAMLAVVSTNVNLALLQLRELNARLLVAN